MSCDETGTTDDTIVLAGTINDDDYSGTFDWTDGNENGSISVDLAVNDAITQLIGTAAWNGTDGTATCTGTSDMNITKQ